MIPALTIAKKEYSLALRSVTTYIIFILFLTATGIYFANTALKDGLAELRGVFGIIHLLLMIYAPAITMGSISKELSTGTFELLSTLPLRLGQIVWGKILAGVMLLVTGLSCSLIYLVLILHFGVGVDLGAVFTGYIGLILAGTAYTAIGIFASSLSTNQVMSFIVGLAISASFYLIQLFSAVLPARLAAFFEYFGFDYHLQSFLKGVIDSRDLVFFAVIVFVFKLLAELRLQSRNMMQEK